MNKKTLIKAVAKRTDITFSEAEKAVDAMLLTIQSELSRQNEVKLVNFGSFSTTERKERIARNPKTGGLVKVPSKHVIKFTPSKGFSEAVAQEV